MSLEFFVIFAHFCLYFYLFSLSRCHFYAVLDSWVTVSLGSSSISNWQIAFNSLLLLSFFAHLLLFHYFCYLSIYCRLIEMDRCPFATGKNYCLLGALFLFLVHRDRRQNWKYNSKQAERQTD